jgi:hypothetical protein
LNDQAKIPMQMIVGMIVQAASINVLCVICAEASWSGRLRRYFQAKRTVPPAITRKKKTQSQ